MANSNSLLVCDGCGLQASFEHVEERIRRLELATKYRPIHIGIVFVTLAPPVQAVDSFYGPPESREFIDPFLEALEILSISDKAGPESSARETEVARLVEFQRRGYFLVHLSECPIGGAEPVRAIVPRLAPNLVRRIRFNYRPKGIALLGHELAPLLETLKSAGIGPLLTTPGGSVLPVPRTGDREAASLLRKALAAAPHREIRAAGL